MKKDGTGGMTLIGTSGYSYREWVGPVYPQGTRPDDFLSQYAGLFPTVELNFSYYQMPTAQQVSGFLEKAGSSLIFSIKANDALTHKIDGLSWKDAAHRFLGALEPLNRENRLGAVLFQFPYSFHYDVDRRRYLHDLLAVFTGIPVAVEFRHTGWYIPRVMDALRERRIALVSLDLPSLRGLPPAIDRVTAPFAYIRFHGRNGLHWWGTDRASRYDYLYSEDELRVWADRITPITLQADPVLVYFNNHPRGQAVQNAQTLNRLLTSRALGQA